MKFFKKLETKQNKNTEFCKADYYVLDYNQLLEVNGAKGESGGGGPSGPSSSPSSSSPSNTSSSSSSSSSGSGKGGSSGGQSAPSSSTTNDTSTNTPTDTTSSSPVVTNDGYIENSNYGVANAKPGDQLKRDDGTIVTITQGDINWAKEQLAKESANSNNTPSNPSSPTNNPSNSTPSLGNNTPVNSGNGQTTTNGNASNDSKMSATDKIENAIETIGKKDYTSDYRCDEYVEDVIKKAGYDPKDYFVDDPSGKNINEHISELKASGNNYTTDVSKVTEGTYVVFMADKDGVKESHAAILVVDSNGNAYMQDNSSKNNATKWDEETGKAIAWDGGTEKYGGNGYTTSKVCEAYTEYDNWYFQKIK